MSATCRSCGAPIVWTITERGKRMPIDPQPDPAGNLTITPDPVGIGDGVVPRATFTRDSGDGRRYLSHFTTCPHAAAHRTRR